MSDDPGVGGTRGNGSSVASPVEPQQTRGEVWPDGPAALLQALPVPACILDLAGPRILMANSAMERLLNYERGQLFGCPLSQIWSERSRPEDLAKGGIEGREGYAHRRDGGLVPVRLTLRSLTCPAALRTFLCTLEDLRPQRELQARLLSAEKLISLGALVAGVAHEVNNPANLLLANIKELSRALNDLLPPSGPLHEQPEGPGVPGTYEERQRIEEVHSILDDAQEGAHRIVDVVRDLVQLSHPDAVPADQVELNQLIETVLRLSRPLLSGTQVQRSLGVIPALRAQRPRLFQVLLNLLINAVHAVSEVELSRRSILLRTQQRAVQGHPGVLLEIEDTGCGMSQAVLDRIYEPFFTTKDAGRGTGLGLALSRTILEQHGGTIQISSKLGKGTLVTVWLPCASPPDLTGAPAPALGISMLRRRY